MVGETTYISLRMFFDQSMDLYILSPAEVIGLRHALDLSHAWDLYKETLLLNLVNYRNGKNNRKNRRMLLAEHSVNTVWFGTMTRSLCDLVVLCSLLF